MDTEFFKQFAPVKGGKNERKITIFYSNLNKSVKPDGFALSLLNDTMPDWLYKGLRIDMVNSLRGFNEDVALEIADDLISCWSGSGLYVTGLKHVDELLGKFYMQILNCANRKGIKLEYDM